MSTSNPYAPPKAQVADVVDNVPGTLAGRWQRIGAVLLDGLVGAVWVVPLWFIFGVWDGLTHGHRQPLHITILLAVLNYAFFALVNGYFLKKSGQTIGKKIAGIRIATLDGGIPELWKLLVLRVGLISFVALIPFIGAILCLIDDLFIFKDDRRTVHDLIAGTKVVRV
jgi:uncharacterized RDD family membrane protein YckC